MVPARLQGRGDEAQGAEYWRREADRLQTEVDRLNEEVEAIRNPIRMLFQGVADGRYQERSVIRIHESYRDYAMAQIPYLDSWDWVAADRGLIYFLSPVASPVLAGASESQGNE